MKSFIDIDFVIQRDNELLESGLPLHARPFHVTIAWMKANKITGSILNSATENEVKAIYRTLYPTGAFSIGSELTGGVAFRDRIYFADANIGYGAFAVEPFKCIRIEPAELELIIQQYPDQAWRGFYAVCDIWDFAYGANDLIQYGTGSEDLLKNARSHFAATPRILGASRDIDAAIQEACLTAELAMKAVLKHLGSGENELKALSHKLPKIAEAVIAKKPASTDPKLIKAASKFPDYVNTRYTDPGLNRVEILELCMRSQFVAADAVRRVSTRNLAGQMEAKSATPDRTDI